MMAVRWQIAPAMAAVVAICLTRFAYGQASQGSQEFEQCKVITDDRARLDCFKELLPKAPSNPSAGKEGVEKDLWPLIRTPRPGGGPDAVAILRTADTTRSDPDLAGLMIRCQDKPGLEVLIALVRPFPLRSKRDVVVTLGTAQSNLHAETAPPGTALSLPIDATTFTTGAWRDLKEVVFKISDPQGDIRGVVELDGIAPAIAKLSANCPSK